MSVRLLVSTTVPKPQQNSHELAGFQSSNSPPALLLVLIFFEQIVLLFVST